jgi:hypothetical protein
MPNLNVEQYSREVIDRYRQNGRYMDHDTARATTIDAASIVASENGQARVSDAARLAGAAIDRYAKQAEAGVSPDRARDAVSKEMSQRFDERGRDTQRQERQRDHSMSL